MSAYEPVIGLEIHAQLLTASKIFCGCSSAFGAPPNTHVCPVCLGLPGALPILNRGAVDSAVRAALALGCTIQETSIFARKNYFYPDLPKGYQISQYEQPLAVHGVLRAGSDYWSPDHDIRITRVHLEEDAGKLLHEGFADSDRKSYVDLNRAGTPLIEIVTEPDLRTPKDAAAFFGYLRELLMAIGVNDGNMEEGSLRCDANVSVRPAGSTKLGTKAEIKNLNSFRFVEEAVSYEIERQIAALETGGAIVQETRLWDSAARRTVSMRSKEEAHDYRYFPEPDLPPLVVDADRLSRLHASLPELPAARRRRLMTAYALTSPDVVMLTTVAPGLDDYFEAVVAAGTDAKTVKNWLLGTVRARMNEEGYETAARLSARVAPAKLAGLIALVERGTISGSTAKEVFDKMFASGRTADEIVHAEGLTQIDDESDLSRLIAEVLAHHADAVAMYQGGKATTFGYLVGQVMKAAAGKANPRRVNELLRKALGAAGAGQQ
ncbi:MAG TPA: Asp-tRNA(Asn)/Glu-tRNA(Gln) amidotransferase subunit GatB [Vicinamibacterales bacterium]|nr:Asp-tRNA(Asn)/Glu-tRNA(Gln) amidotransferase subunit GatB [Vicinamibacterales bacterium]